MSLSLVVTLLSFGALVAAHGDHSGAEHDHDCACRAVELSFKIDCADTATMLNALQTLRNNTCLSSGTKCKLDPVCDKAFAIVLSHHDHCLAPPPEIANKTEVHAYEDVCTTCKISKQFNPALPVCAPTKCDAAAEFTTAYAVLDSAANACAVACNKTECANSFRLLRGAYHRCDGDKLPDAVEKGVHGYDGACEAVDCNPADKAAVPVCTETSTTKPAATTSASSLVAPLHAPLAVVVFLLWAVALHGPY